MECFLMLFSCLDRVAVGLQSPKLSEPLQAGSSNQIMFQFHFTWTTSFARTRVQLLLFRFETLWSAPLCHWEWTPRGTNKASKCSFHATWKFGHEVCCIIWFHHVATPAMFMPLINFNLIPWNLLWSWPCQNGGWCFWNCKRHWNRTVICKEVFNVNFIAEGLGRWRQPDQVSFSGSFAGRLPLVAPSHAGHVLSRLPPSRTPEVEVLQLVGTKVEVPTDCNQSRMSIDEGLGEKRQNVIHQRGCLRPCWPSWKTIEGYHCDTVVPNLMLCRQDSSGVPKIWRPIDSQLFGTKIRGAGNTCPCARPVWATSQRGWGAEVCSQQAVVLTSRKLQCLTWRNLSEGWKLGFCISPNASPLRYSQSFLGT